MNFIDPDGRIVWAIPAMKFLAYATGAAVTLYAAQKLTKYEASKYNPGWDYQRENDRKGKEALDKAHLNVQNNINNNFNNDNDDGTPKLNPNKKGASVVIATLFIIHNNLTDPLTGRLKESIINYLKAKNEEKSSKESNNPNSPQSNSKENVELIEEIEDEESFTGNHIVFCLICSICAAGDNL